MTVTKIEVTKAIRQIRYARSLGQARRIVTPIYRMAEKDGWDEDCNHRIYRAMRRAKQRRSAGSII